MDRKRKLETSLEGLFSKSKGAKEPTKVEKKAESPLPAVEEKQKKSSPATKKTESKTADKNTDKKARKTSKVVKVEALEVEPVIVKTPIVEEETVIKKEEIPETIKLDIVNEKRRPEPIKPQAAPETVRETKPVAAIKKEGQALATLPIAELAVMEEEGDTQLLVFEINQVQYAIDVSMVQTIIKPQAVFLVPGTAEYLKGLLNLRGDVVPVIDLRTRFDLEPQEVTKDTRFVVVKINDIMASMVVDKVHGVETIPLSLIGKPSGLVMDIDNRYLTGMARYEDQIILILDLMHTINPHRVEQR